MKSHFASLIIYALMFQIVVLPGVSHASPQSQESFADTTAMRDSYYDTLQSQLSRESRNSDFPSTTTTFSSEYGWGTIVPAKAWPWIHAGKQIEGALVNTGVDIAKNLFKLFMIGPNIVLFFGLIVFSPISAIIAQIKHYNKVKSPSSKLSGLESKGFFARALKTAETLELQGISTDSIPDSIQLLLKMTAAMKEKMPTPYASYSKFERIGLGYGNPFLPWKGGDAYAPLVIESEFHEYQMCLLLLSQQLREAQQQGKMKPSELAELFKAVQAQLFSVQDRSTIGKDLKKGRIRVGSENEFVTHIFDTHRSIKLEEFHTQIVTTQLYDQALATLKEFSRELGDRDAHEIFESQFTAGRKTFSAQENALTPLVIEFAFSRNAEKRIELGRAMLRELRSLADNFVIETHGTSHLQVADLTEEYVKATHQLLYGVRDVMQAVTYQNVDGDATAKEIAIGVLETLAKCPIPRVTVEINVSDFLAHFGRTISQDPRVQSTLGDALKFIRSGYSMNGVIHMRPDTNDFKDSSKLETKGRLTMRALEAYFEKTFDPTNDAHIAAFLISDTFQNRVEAELNQRGHLHLLNEGLNRYHTQFIRPAIQKRNAALKGMISVEGESDWDHNDGIHKNAQIKFGEMTTQALTVASWISRLPSQPGQTSTTVAGPNSSLPCQALFH